MSVQKQGNNIWDVNMDREDAITRVIETLQAIYQDAMMYGVKTTDQIMCKQWVNYVLQLFALDNKMNPVELKRFQDRVLYTYEKSRRLEEATAAPFSRLITFLRTDPLLPKTTIEAAEVDKTS